MIRHFTLPLVLLLAACASSPSDGDVSVLGTEEDVARYAGRWTGTVAGTVQGGPIDFTIVPRPGRDGGKLTVTAAPAGVAILYVRITGTQFASAAKPQYDESCRCDVYRTMSGELSGDTIRGEIHRLENRSRDVTATFSATRVR